jgi:hypothetical protein
LGHGLRLDSFNKAPFEFGPAVSKLGDGACLTASGTCAAGAAAGIVGGVKIAAKATCAAALAQIGIDAVNDAACVYLKVAAGVAALAEIATCSGAVLNCTHNSPPPTTHTTATVGMRSGTTTTHFCPASHKIYSLKLYKSNSLGSVGRIEASCSDGTTLVFGRNFGDAAINHACYNDKLLAGLQTRSGDRIDSVGAICDPVGKNDSQSPDIIYRLFGGTGGALKYSYCPEHQYVIGIKTWHAPTRLGSNSSINGLELYCK